MFSDMEDEIMVDIEAIQAEIALQDSVIEATQNVAYPKNPLMQKIVHSRKNKKIK